MARWILVDRKPVLEHSVQAWSIWFDKDENRRVASTYVTPNAHVSTVFLGLGLALFETMALGDGLELQRRYVTWEEAEDGHWEVVAEVCNHLGVPIPERPGVPTQEKPLSPTWYERLLKDKEDF